MSLQTAILSVVFIFLMPHANSAVYKCVGADGKKTFQSTPCAGSKSDGKVRIQKQASTGSQLREPKSEIEYYALEGAAAICSESDYLTLEQRLQMTKIESQFSSLRYKAGLPVDVGLGWDASKEMFGIRYNYNVHYDKCMRALTW